MKNQVLRSSIRKLTEGWAVFADGRQVSDAVPNRDDSRLLTAFENAKWEHEGAHITIGASDKYMDSEDRMAEQTKKNPLKSSLREADDGMYVNVTIDAKAKRLRFPFHNVVELGDNTPEQLEQLKQFLNQAPRRYEMRVHLEEHEGSRGYCQVVIKRGSAISFPGGMISIEDQDDHSIDRFARFLKELDVQVKII